MDFCSLILRSIQYYIKLLTHPFTDTSAFSSTKWINSGFKYLLLSCQRSKSKLSTCRRAPGMAAMIALFTLLVSDLLLEHKCYQINHCLQFLKFLLCGRCSVKDLCWEWWWCGMGTRPDTDASRLQTPAPWDPHSSRLMNSPHLVGAPGHSCDPACCVTQ